MLIHLPPGIGGPNNPPDSSPGKSIILHWSLGLYMTDVHGWCEGWETEGSLVAVAVSGLPMDTADMVPLA